MSRFVTGTTYTTRETMYIDYVDGFNCVCKDSGYRKE